jgi:hypothetical protein
MNEKFNDIVKKFEQCMQEMLATIRESVVGKDAVIPRGKYAGRVGRVCEVSLSQDRVTLLIHPYNLHHPGDLLNDHPDARSYWPYTEVNFLPEKRSSS